MIKQIPTINWPEIVEKINHLPEDKRRSYFALRTLYESEINKDPVNHEVIASLIAKANELLCPIETIK